MTKKTILLFAAEILAVAILRLTYMVRRDKLWMPRASKVNDINRRPVYRQPHIKPRVTKKDLDSVRSIEIQGWTNELSRGKVRDTPDGSPDA